MLSTQLDNDDMYDNGNDNDDNGISDDDDDGGDNLILLSSLTGKIIWRQTFFKMMQLSLCIQEYSDLFLL